MMGCCLAVGLVGGVWIGVNYGQGIICDRNDVLCRYLRVDGKIFVIHEKEKH